MPTAKELIEAIIEGSKLDGKDIAHALKYDFKGNATIKDFYSVDKSTPKKEIDAAVKDAINKELIRYDSKQKLYVLPGE